MGTTNTDTECASLVIAQKPEAAGITWFQTKKQCWAERVHPTKGIAGNSVVNKNLKNHRACIFTAGNNF